MRRFSSRNSLVTLNDINITPLLDLAFVLLIIFVITTPLLEQSMDLSMYQGGQKPPEVRREDIRVVEVNKLGEYSLSGRRLPLGSVIGELITTRRANPNLVVHIRADQEGRTRDVYAVIDACQRNGIERFSLRTEPVRLP